MSPPTSTPCAKPARTRWRPPDWLGWLAGGGALACAAIAAGGLVVVEAGLFDARALTPHGPIVGWATHTAMMKAVRRQARDVQPPPGFSGAQLTEGFRLYDAHCAMCHGGPGVARATWTTGLTPTPPFLLDAARVWTPAQLKLIVGDGVKMTAMPAWRTTLSDPEVWDLVGFLEALPGLSAADYARLRATEAARTREAAPPAISARRTPAARTPPPG